MTVSIFDLFWDVSFGERLSLIVSDRREPNCGVKPMHDSIPCILSLVCLNQKKVEGVRDDLV